MPYQAPGTAALAATGATLTLTGMLGLTVLGLALIAAAFALLKLTPRRDRS